MILDHPTEQYTKNTKNSSSCNLARSHDTSRRASCILFDRRPDAHVDRLYAVAIRDGTADYGVLYEDRNIVRVSKDRKPVDAHHAPLHDVTSA